MSKKHISSLVGIDHRSTACQVDDHSRGLFCGHVNYTVSVFTLTVQIIIGREEKLSNLDMMRF